MNLKVQKTCKFLESHKTKLFVILIFALLLRLKFFVGIGGNDDFVYSNTSIIFLRNGFGNYPFESMAGLRLMVVIPLAIVYHLFGASNFTAGLFPLICSLASIIITYKIAELLFNKEVGLLAAVLYSIFPIDVVFATQLVPSIPLTMFWLLSIYSFICSVEDSSFFGIPLHSNSKLFLSGTFWGLSYLTNISAIFLFPFFPLYILIKKKFQFKYLLIIAGFCLVFIGENILYYHYREKVLWRLDVGHQEEIRVVTNTALDYYPRVIFKIFDINYFSHEGHIGIFAYTFLILSPYLFYKKDKKSLVFVVFTLLVFGYMQFGIMTTTGRPIIKWMRYLIRFIPFITIPIARSMTLMFNDKKLQKNGVYYFYISLITFVLTILTAPYFFSQAASTYEISLFDFHMMEAYFKTQPKKKIYSDWGTLAYIEPYLGYRYDVVNIESISTADEIHDAYVIIDGSRASVENKETIDKFPEFIASHKFPAEWQIVKEIVGPNKGGYEHYNPKIFYAP